MVVHTSDSKISATHTFNYVIIVTTNLNVVAYCICAKIWDNLLEHWLKGLPSIWPVAHRLGVMRRLVTQACLALGWPSRLGQQFLLILWLSPFPLALSGNGIRIWQVSVEWQIVELLVVVYTAERLYDPLNNSWDIIFGMRSDIFGISYMGRHSSLRCTMLRRHRV